MAEKTGIQWTDKTWSPWTGCQSVSEACRFCYAEALDKRFGKGDRWGPHGKRARTSVDYWQKPFAWNRAALRAEECVMVFPSMCDPWDNHRSIEVMWRLDFLDLIRTTPLLIWQLLTKRPQNTEQMLHDLMRDARAMGMRDLSEWIVAWLDGEYPENVWLGATAEDQRECERRQGPLVAVPAAVHFLSAEPLLEPIKPCLDGIALVICGGGSGRTPQWMDPDWARALRDHCAAAGTAFFMKQMSGRTQAQLHAIPDDLMIREFPAC
jgi:protein gp37